MPVSGEGSGSAARGALPQAGKIMESELKESSYGNFIQAIPISDIAAELFFSRLFGIDPGLRRQFEGDLLGRRRAFEWMIGAAVKGMPNLRPLIQALEAMAAPRSAESSVNRDCETLSDAFVSSLGKTLGPRFTVEMRKGWLAVFELLHALSDRECACCGQLAGSTTIVDSGSFQWQLYR